MHFALLAIAFTMETAVCTAQNTAFTVYDNVYYPGKPDLRPSGRI